MKPHWQGLGETRANLALPLRLSAAGQSLRQGRIRKAQHDGDGKHGYALAYALGAGYLEMETLKQRCMGKGVAFM